MIQDIKNQIGKLIFLEPFFASIALGLKVEIDPDPNATAWVMGDKMGFGINFWKSLNPKQKRTLICHEVMHKALLHDLRIPRLARDGNFDIWNRACDYAINQHLLDPTRFEFPPNGQTDRENLNRFKNKSAEQIFSILIEEAKDEDEDDKQNEDDPNHNTDEPDTGESSSEGEGSGDDTGDNPDTGDQTTESQVGEWGEVRPCDENKDTEEEIAQRKREVRQAMLNAQQSGSMPAGIEQDILEKVMKPSLPWEQILENAMGQIAPIDFSFQSPKQINNILLPRFMSESIGRIVIILDASGSMTPPHMEKAIAETRNATRVFEDAGMDQTFALIYADTIVQSCSELLPDDPIPKPKGGGGTCFTSAFNFVDKMEDEPLAVIVITDGFVNVPNTCKYDTIFLITPNGSPRFTNEPNWKSTDLIIRMSN